MHLTLKIYLSSLSEFQVMTLIHHHTKVMLIFNDHIAVTTKQFEQMRPAEWWQMYSPPIGPSTLKDAMTFVNTSPILIRALAAI